MKRDRPFSIGFPLILFCLQCISTIQSVQSLEKTKAEPPPSYYQGDQGKPGLDFPILTAIPKTSFSCKEIETGYYADLETNCQVFHICEDGKKTSFLCPNGTIFQQSDLICDWWFKVNCTSSPLLYEESSEQLKEEIIKKKSARRLTFKTRPNSNNPKKDVTTQNKYPINDAEKKSRTYSKPNWSSVYDEWTTRGNNRQIGNEVVFKTTEEYRSTTERIETSTRKLNSYRKLIPIRRKKPTSDATTEANVMIVTPETTTKIRTSSPYRKRIQYKDLKKIYSSTTSKGAEETTTAKNLVSSSTQKFDEDKYVNIFVGTRQKVLRANNHRLSNKKYQKNKKNPSSTSYLNGESNVLSGDSDETQIPQETASIVENRYNNFNGFYENHKPEYSEIKDPKLYNEKYFNSIVPVTSQYVTTQSFNTGKIFVGSSVGITIPRNKTLSIKDHNRKTFKLSAIAFNTAQALNPFHNRNEDLPTTDDNQSTKPMEDTTEPIMELLTVPNPKNIDEGNNKDVLKISTISFNTAQAYESLFKDDTKSEPVVPEEAQKVALPSESTVLPVVPEEAQKVSPSETPFTSRLLEIPTTTEEPDQIQIRFNEEPTEKAPLKPRPFELQSTEPTYLESRNDKSDDPSPYPFFKVSKASPFSLRESSIEITEYPTTEPTNLYVKPEEVILNNEESSETSRPGLVVPSSVSPQTLHTLATYFETALSNMTSEEREILNLNGDDDMEEKLKVLLSHMTRQKYDQLFLQMDSRSEETTTTKDVEEEESTDDPQKVRKLAKLFSQALSEYLHDPAYLKNRLIQVRPTEPPSNVFFNTEKELLSFSEDDTKNTLTSWNFKASNKSDINSEENNYITSDGEGLSIADSQSFVSQFNNLNHEDRQKVDLPKNHWTSSPHATNLWRTTFAVDPFSLNKDFLVTESYSTITDHPDIEEEKEIKYELRVFPSNSSKLQGILIDFMNSSTTSESERLHRILRKLNTTEDEFIDRMKKIEENPLTRRLILLLIHECEATKNEKEELIPFLNPEKEKEDIFSSDVGSNGDEESVNKDQDARALQLLNSLYNIATKFGR